MRRLSAGGPDGVAGIRGTEVAGTTTASAAKASSSDTTDGMTPSSPEGLQTPAARTIRCLRDHDQADTGSQVHQSSIEATYLKAGTYNPGLYSPFPPISIRQFRGTCLGPWEVWIRQVASTLSAAYGIVLKGQEVLRNRTMGSGRCCGRFSTHQQWLRPS